MTEEASAVAPVVCRAGVVTFVAGFGFVVPVLALGAVIVGDLVVRVASFTVAGGLGRCAGAAVVGFAGAGSSARRGVLVAGGPAGTAVGTRLDAGRGAVRSGSREATFVMTRAIATPVATAEMPTVSQLRMARAGGVGATRRASCELAGMGGGSGATIEVASWPWVLAAIHRREERRDGGLAPEAGSSSDATIISGSTSRIPASDMDRPTTALPFGSLQD